MRQHYSGFCTVLFAKAEHYAQYIEPLSLAEHQCDREAPVTNKQRSAVTRHSWWSKPQSAAHLFSRLLSVFLLLSVLGLASCQGDVIEQASLSIEHDGGKDLTMSGTGEEIVIPVKTNITNWKAMTNASWLRLREVANNLVVQAEPNPLVEERVANIVVIAGSKELQISVRQLVDKANAITLSPEELNVERLAKDYRILVRTSSDKWIVKKEPEDADWVSFLPRPRYGEIIASFAENKSRQTRSCRLIVQDGEITNEIVVSQKGIPHFFLPYLQWESDLSDAEEFEVKRNSRITLRPRQANPLAGQRAIPYFQFSTVSSAFQQVRYEYTNFGTRFLYKATLVAQDLSVVEGDGLVNFLKSENFVPRTDLKSTENSQFFINQERKIHLQYSIDQRAKEAYLIFTPIVEQTVAYSVPAKLPMGFPIAEGSTKQDVEKWEEQMKGEKSDNLTQSFGLLTYFATDPYFIRFYLFTENDPNKLEAVNFALDPKYQGMHRYGGLYFMGKEFDALIRAEGFVYDSYDQTRGTHFYVHQEKQLRFAVGMIRMANLDLTRCQITMIKPSAN